MTAPAESSPAPSIAFAPTGDARTEWLKSGNVPEATPKTEEPAPSKETSAEVDETKEKTAPTSEVGEKPQEQKRRSNAESRLDEILDDLRAAGLTPKQLKNFQNDYERKGTAKAEPSAKTAPEQTEKPAETGLKAPTKPKAEDFEGKPWSEYEAAKDEYSEKLAEYKAAKAVEDYRAQQKQEASQKELQAKVADAEKRYGAETKTVIAKTAAEIFGDTKINGVVKQMLNDSPVLVDVLYALGLKDADLTDFLADASQNPGAAIRKLVLVEKLVIEDLASGGKSEPADGKAARGDDGKFTKTAPEKKTTEAPPPPKEVSGQRTAPPDVTEDAIKRGDARAFIDAENAKELARIRGR